MTRTQRALSIFQNGLNCSQGIFSSFAEELGIREEKTVEILEKMVAPP